MLCMKKSNYVVIAKISSSSNLQTTVANIIQWTDPINLRQHKQILYQDKPHNVAQGTTYCSPSCYFCSEIVKTYIEF